MGSSILWEIFGIEEHKNWIVHTYIFGRNQNNILDELLIFWKKIEIVQKRGMVTSLFWWLTVDNC
jgi:hypothetical protein